MSASLDPDDWTTWTKLAQQVMADVPELLNPKQMQPIWRDVPQSTLEYFTRPIPRIGQPIDQLYLDIKKNIVPYSTGNRNPRYWGWAMGGGSAAGVLADTIASVMNSNAIGGVQASTLVEKQVLRWIGELLGYPHSATGLFVSGASMANFIGLAVALRKKAGDTLPKAGLQSFPQCFRAYGSTETHKSIAKAIRLLGVGNDNFVRLAVDSEFRVDCGEVRKAIVSDIANGHTPFCIVANAGTVNTGAIDQLPELVSLSKEFGLWLHVDAAIGAPLALIKNETNRLRGISEADSIALDLHKWAQVPYEAGCCLVRHPDDHAATFEIDSDYLAQTSAGFDSGSDWFCDLGLELSRSFKALGAWMTFQAYGSEGLGNVIQRNIDQAQHLFELLSKEPLIELFANSALNIVCFRYRPPSLTAAEVEGVNAKLVAAIQNGGEFMVSHTRIRGNLTLRVCLMNHRTTFQDVQSFMDCLRSNIRILK